MKRLMLIGCVLLAAFAAAGESVNLGKQAKARTNFMKRTGGFIYQDKDKAGKFGIVLATKSLTPSELENTVSEIAKFTLINVELIEAEVARDAEDAALAESGAQAVLFVVDVPKLPRLLIAPESKWGYLNVSGLRDEKTTRPRFLDRVSRELWRGVGMVAGAYCSNMEHCLMAPVFDVDTLDRLDACMYSPATLNSVAPALKKMGINMVRRTTYRTACKEGWAPAPTNEFQKAIWDQVHAIPDKPLTIKKQK